MALLTHGPRARGRGRVALTAAVSLLTLAAATSVVSTPVASAGSGLRIVDSLPGRTVKIKADRIRKSRAESIAFIRPQAAVATPAAARIQVQYTGFPAAARNAFQAAVNVWAARLQSPRVIRVNANWRPLGTGVLGAAGPAAMYGLSDGFAYPAALAEAICRCNGPAQFEINAYFNSSFTGWFFGTGGNTPASQYDFMSVVLHELGHGLGFVSTYNVASNGLGSWGLTGGGRTWPTRFDTNIWSAAIGGTKLTNTRIVPNPSQALRVQLTDNTVYDGGPHARSFNRNARARIYAPNPWRQGSSLSHLDETSYPAGTVNSLMTPFLANGEAIHDPGSLTLAIMRDIGWVTNPDAPDIRIVNASRPEGDRDTTVIRLRVRLSAPAGHPVTVQYRTLNGTAKAPRDYVARSGVLIIPAGVSSRVIRVAVKGNRVRERNERFLVFLRGSSGGGILDSIGVATIRNDD
jgi:hypothetical protein